MTTFNLADLFELMAAKFPDRLALVAGDVRMTYAELDGRADRLASALIQRGVEPGDFVGVLSWNRAEWCEAMLACHKIRAASINLNYRYLKDELAYVLRDAGITLLIAERSFLELIDAASADLDSAPRLLVLDDSPVAQTGAGRGAEDYEAALAAAPQFARPDRSSDDLYVLYTGGTTGMPKGVLWRCEDIFKAAMQGRDIESPEDILAKASSTPFAMSVLAPLMHGAGQWVFWIAMTSGGSFVLWTGQSFDAEKVLEMLAKDRAMVVAVVGDAMASPLADAIEADPERHDLSGLAVVASGGAMLSTPVREKLKRHLPNLMIADGYGASEIGDGGRAFDSKASSRRTFALDAQSAVLDDNLEPVAPGSGTIGRLARRGHIPLGYHGDPVKTSATFPTDANGVRWAVPGDLATVEADGSVRLLGRGSTVINSGGEKIYPDEVEDAIKTHGDVLDAVVVGIPEPRFGQQVAALVVARDDTIDLDDLLAHVRTRIAGYKAPRRVFIVEQLQRTPAGKSDQQWAKDTATSLAGIAPS